MKRARQMRDFLEKIRAMKQHRENQKPMFVMREETIAGAE